IQQQLKEQFRRHEPERVYLAIVRGLVKPESGTWRDRISWDERALIQRAAHPADPRAKTAVSRYRVVEAFRHASLLEVRLVTGKRNQIRIQASLRGHALVGERQYLDKNDDRGAIAFPRQALHAARLQFVHPVSGQKMAFEAPMPRDMAELLA